jgi:hypothetical protein
MQISNRRHLAGRFAFSAAIAGTVVAPLHALARFATTDGAGDLKSPLVHWWAVPAARALRPLLDWASPTTVYLSYGKLFLPIMLATTVFAFVVHRARAPLGFEKWAWRIALSSYVLITASVLGDFWTPWTDLSFAVLDIPGLLVGLIGSTLLGIALLRRDFRPRSTAWLLATFVFSAVALDSVIAMGAVLLPLLWAWGLAGRRMTASVTDAEPVPVA